MITPWDDCQHEIVLLRQELRTLRQRLDLAEGALERLRSAAIHEMTTDYQPDSMGRHPTHPGGDL